MNSTLRTIQFSTWKQTRIRYLLAAASIPLIAVLVLTGIMTLPRDSAEPALNPAPAGPEARTISRDAPRDVVVYIVDNLTDKEALERDRTFSEWFDQPGTGGATTALRVVVIEPSQEESLGLLADLVPESGMTTGGGARLTLFDLR